MFDQQFEDSIKTAATENGGRIQASAEGGIDAVIAANGKAIAWRCPGSPTDPETVLATRALATVLKANGAIAKANADPDRSDAWKAAETARIAEDAAGKFAAIAGEIDKRVGEFTAADQAAVQPPALAASDHNGGLVDHECRAWARSLARDEQVALGAELHDGQHARTLLALARSPVPLPPWLRETVASAWADAQAKLDPAQYRLRQQASTRIEWVRQLRAQGEAALPALPLDRMAALHRARNNQIADRT